MKKILILILTIPLFIACNSKDFKIPLENDIIQFETSNITVSNIEETGDIEEGVTVNTIPIYEDINQEVEAYFRMFYENNKEYTFTQRESKTLIDSGRVIVTGYFNEDSLVWIDLIRFGDRKSRFTQYYIINDNLIYVTYSKCWFYEQPVEEYEEYYIINRKVFRYNRETENLIELLDSDEIEIYESVKYDVLDDETLQAVQNIYTIPIENNLFNQFTKFKNEYFEEFYGMDIQYENRQFNVDTPDFYSKIDKVVLLLYNSKNYLVSLQYSDETTFIRYNYYPIDDTRIYVIVYNQEFENEEIDFNKMKKSYYEEYFIVNDIVMIYDTEKQDLVESPENQDILTYYNTAIEKIED